MFVFGFRKRFLQGCLNGFLLTLRLFDFALDLSLQLLLFANLRLDSSLLLSFEGGSDRFLEILAKIREQLFFLDCRYYRSFDETKTDRTMLGPVQRAWLLDSLEAGLLKKILGILIVLFAVHIYRRSGREREPRTREGGRIVGAAIALFVGVLSGIAGGMFGTSGPPLVVYVDHFAKDKSAFRAQLVVLFMLNNAVRIVLYSWHSLLTVPIAKFALWLLPAVMLGLFLGSKMHFQVSEKTFSKAIAAMLCISGLLLVIRP